MELARQIQQVGILHGSSIIINAFLLGLFCCTLGQIDGPPRPIMQTLAPSAEFEVSHPDSDSLDGDEEIVYPAEANDVFNPTTVKSIWDKLHEITPLEAWQQWPSKAKRKTTTKNYPRYDNEVTVYIIFQRHL